MNLLLDTHTFLWWLDRPDSLSAAARSAVGDPRLTVFVSVVTLREIDIKRAAGRLQFPGDPRAYVRSNGFKALPIVEDHALATETLPPIHRDPFDRLLVAQAVVEGLQLVSLDADVRRYPVPLIVA